jgi:hypothetical protein
VNAGGWSERRPRDRGFILVEVAVAVLLLAVLVVPLVSALRAAEDRAAQTRSQQWALSADALDDAGEAAWRWGLGVNAVWLPGPSLQLMPKQTAPDELAGLWSDGWFVGEWRLPAAGSLVLGPSIWSGQGGKEVTVRVRRADDVWGPCMRLTVPSGFEAGPTEEALVGVRPQVGGMGRTPTGLETMVHFPAAASPAVSVSPLVGDVIAGPLGIGCTLPCAEVGSCGFCLSRQTQSWRMEEGRALDLYF